MANEIIVFDATGSKIDGTDPGSALTVGPGTSYRLREGTEFPAAPLDVLYSSSVDTEGELPASRRYGNRSITIKIGMVDPTGSLLAALQAKLAKFQREGGTVKRTLKNGDVRIYDIVAADGWTPTYDWAYWLSDFTEVQMVLPARPLSRGAEVTLSDHIETTLPWLVFTETTVAGDAPALGRLVIDNDEAATAQRWMAWSIQQRYYDSASTAALFYQAESCALFAGVATAIGPTGASGSGNNVAKNTALTVTQDGQIYVGTSSTAQTHIGVFRVFTRVYAPNTNTGLVSVGLTWIPYPQGPTISNPNVKITTDPSAPGGGPLENQWALVDLGLVTLPKAKKGTQGWIGYVTASSTVAGDDLNIDWVALVPVDEGYGEAKTLNYAGNSLVAGASGISAEVRYDGVLTQNAAGTYWVEPDAYEGDYLLVPPSGAEARTLRVITRFGRHFPLNADELASPDIITSFPDITADVSARLFVTPRYLT